MSTARQPEIDSIPAALDRFLGGFFDRRGWRSEIKYDPVRDCLYLNVRLAGGALSGDDRFLSLIERFSRLQGERLRRRAGLPLQCRLYAPDGNEITADLHRRGSSYLDDDARASRMRRRLAWLGFRRRIVGGAVPGALLWAVTLGLAVAVIGLPLPLALCVAGAAVALQVGALLLEASLRR
ncbi:MAG: hypothetical protein WC709_06360 [Thermoleophilia bacterium]